MSIRKFVKSPYLIPDGVYTARVCAVRQKSQNGRRWTVVCLEIVDGFFKSRRVFDVIRRDGFAAEDVEKDRARERALVRLGGKRRKYTRACRSMIGRLAEIEVGSEWRADLDAISNRIRAYRRTVQF